MKTYLRANLLCEVPCEKKLKSTLSTFARRYDWQVQRGAFAVFSPNHYFGSIYSYQLIAYSMFLPLYDLPPGVDPGAVATAVAPGQLTGSVFGLVLLAIGTLIAGLLMRPTTVRVNPNEYIPPDYVPPEQPAPEQPAPAQPARPFSIDDLYGDGPPAPGQPGTGTGGDTVHSIADSLMPGMYDPATVAQHAATAAQKAALAEQAAKAAAISAEEALQLMLNQAEYIPIPDGAMSLRLFEQVRRMLFNGLPRSREEALPGITRISYTEHGAIVDLRRADGLTEQTFIPRRFLPEYDQFYHEVGPRLEEYPAGMRPTYESFWPETTEEWFLALFATFAVPFGVVALLRRFGGLTGAEVVLHLRLRSCLADNAGLFFLGHGI